MADKCNSVVMTRATVADIPALIGDVLPLISAGACRLVKGILSQERLA